MTTTNQNGGTGSTVAEMNSGGWKGRGNLGSLVAELKRQKESKIDFVADGRCLEIVPATGGGLRLLGGDPQTREWIPGGGLVISEQALEQIGERCDPSVPVKFTKALASKRPEIAADLLTELLNVSGKRHLIRCLDGKVRAFLSDRYRILDHEDIAFAALEVAQSVGAEVFECSLSDTNMRIKFTDLSVWDAIDTVQKGDKGGWFAGGLGNQKHLSKVGAASRGELPGGPGTVHPCVTISNSETGHGGLGLRGGILAGICFNLATIEEIVMKLHLGERLDAGVLSREAIEADGKAIMLKARDGIRAAFTPAVFKRLVATMREAEADTIKAPTAAVGNLVENAGLTEEAKASILEYFLRDYSSTRNGLAQAVARFAQDSEDAENAFALENAAGSLVRGRDLIGSEV